ncbi:MAG: hypothetical protein ABIN48_12005, partial [Ginsengibacter sp.]
MQDEEYDKRIKEAADHYHPAYDDKAWEKMEQLLDQHLPQEKKKRRIIYFLLPFLLLGSIIIYFAIQNGEKDIPSGKRSVTSQESTTGPASAPALSKNSNIMDSNFYSGKKEITWELIDESL